MGVTQEEHDVISEVVAVLEKMNDTMEGLLTVCEHNMKSISYVERRIRDLEEVLHGHRN